MKLRALLNEITNQYGEGSVAQANKAKGTEVIRFSSGVFALDRALGGGFVWGRFHRVIGPESGCKTGICLKTVASAQRYCRYCRCMFVPDENGELMCACPKMCFDCQMPYRMTEYDHSLDNSEVFDWERLHDAWVCDCLTDAKRKSDRVPVETNRCSPIRTAWFDAEGCYDRRWSEALGVDNELVYVLQTEYAEQGIDIVDAMLRSGEIDLIIIDSLAALTPTVEIEETAERQQMGVAARLINKAVRKWTSAINEHGINRLAKPAIIAINQEREKIGGYGGKVTPGGKGQQYASSIDVRCGSAKYEMKSEVAVYADVQGFIKKNKTYVPRLEFSFRFYLTKYKGNRPGDTYEESVVFDNALDYGVITREKNKYYYGDLVWSTQKEVKELFEEDPWFMQQIRNETMDRILNPDD